MDRKLYTLKAAAEALSVSRTTIYEWIKKGEIQQVRIVTGEKNARPFVTGASMDAFVERQVKREAEIQAKAEGTAERQVSKYG